jgi:hypothetical protein
MLRLQLFQEPFPAIPPSGLQQFQPSQQVSGMGSLIGVKFSNVLALLGDLPLAIRNSRVSFRKRFSRAD